MPDIVDHRGARRNCPTFSGNSFSGLQSRFCSRVQTRRHPDFRPSVFSALFNAPMLRAAFAMMILGLIASLARMWFLTFKGRW